MHLLRARRRLQQVQNGGRGYHDRLALARAGADAVHHAGSKAELRWIGRRFVWQRFPATRQRSLPVLGAEVSRMVEERQP